MTPHAFIAKWRPVTLSERSACQQLWELKTVLDCPRDRHLGQRLPLGRPPTDLGRPGVQRAVIMAIREKEVEEIVIL